ncbi:MAG: SMC family ATPase [Desulfurococcaceae archaeon]
MRILGVLVENIRSYKKDVIILPPNGITVIYGPSGSGKTSLLMSINFALFGMATGSKSGDLFDSYKTPHGVDLLRVDSARGRVKLLVALGNKLYVIERTLEKQGNRFSSGTGAVEEYALDDRGVLKLAKKRVFESRTEMDSYIADILGVREKRSERGVATPLVYTTALYVPQFKAHEVMALESKERIEIVERALGLEKYKLFKSNYEKILKVLKDRLKEIEVKSSEYSKRLKEKNKDKLLKDKEQLLAERNKVMQEKDVVENEYTKLVEQERVLLDRLKSLELKKQELYRKVEEHRKIEDKLMEVEKKIAELLKIEEYRGHPANKVVEMLQKKLRELEAEKGALEGEITNIDVKLATVEDELGRLRAKLILLEKNASERKKEAEVVGNVLAETEKEYKEIEELVKKGICPVCRQPITHEHGLKLIMEKSKKIDAEKARLEQLSRELEELTKEIEEFKKAEKALEEEKSRLSEERSSVMKRRDDVFGEIKKLSELLTALNELLSLRNSLVSEIAKISAEEIRLSLKAVEKEIPGIYSELEKTRQRIKSILERREKLAKELGRIEEALKVVERDLREVEKLNEELTKIQSKLNTMKSVGELLERASQAIEEVEISVLKILASEFRRYFYEYIAALIPDQPVEVAVMDDFSLSQKIKIGGSFYDVSSLSGGQSTAISLAYRLALNQTVRKYSPTLRKGVLILDEPTTGFSRELVIRLKDLLKGMSGIEGQVIVVTHDEALIEAGDCKIRLSLDVNEHKTLIDYEDCALEEDYRRLVEDLLKGRHEIQRMEVPRSADEFEPKVTFTTS